MVLDRKIIDLIASFFVNLSSTYFIAATVTPTSSYLVLTYLFNFILNILLAIIYFGLSIKIIKLYDGKMDLD